VFEQKETSYAAGTTEKTQNCGVIAVKVLAEKAKPLPEIVKTVVQHHHVYELYYVPRPYPWPPYYPIWSSAVQSGSSATGVYCCSTNLSGADTLAAKSSNADGLTRSLQSEGAVPAFKLGTGWGENRQDHVSTDDFERDRELTTLTIYYADADSLKEAGIALAKEMVVSNPLPQAFGEFCREPVFAR
jgi:hypothetical protein